MPKKSKSKKTVTPATLPRADRQADDEFCTCCEELCDCEDCQECTADTETVLPVKTRWTQSKP